ncbi:hypothetical protein [Deefgea salmonis]|uniref:Uncharacterized protein n=1 Tax=Deefgea salmonis TaxID=2875502 RepID=A0ABS8BIV5_9NEIS|nr:hypothetical protein [Deefgea salmonis]MCB5195645.1 hypothetical protein [Deefgea salmonis]
MKFSTKKYGLLGLGFLLVAGLASASATTEPTQLAKDHHGCVGEEGYSWCVKQQQCVRPSKVLIDNDLELTAENFHSFCENNR